jgi:hypothetical protein
MTVEFLEEAEQELTEAALWYEEKELGLGSRLRDEVAHIASRIAEDPMLWREREGGYRRIFLSHISWTINVGLRGGQFLARNLHNSSGYTYAAGSAIRRLYPPDP